MLGEVLTAVVTPFRSDGTLDLPDDVLGGVPVESVESAARAVSEALDSSDVMGATPYVLEVTSPGVDRMRSIRRSSASSLSLHAAATLASRRSRIRSRTASSTSSLLL